MDKTGPGALPSRPDPSRSPRRVTDPRLARGQDGAEVFLYVGGMFLGIGSILSTVFCWGLPTDFGLDARGRPTLGIVLAAELDTSMRINRRHPMRVTWTYEVAGRTFRDDDAGIDPLYFQYVTPGMEIPLEVDAAHPERSRIAGTSRALFGRWGALLLFFPLLGLGLIGAWARERWGASGRQPSRPL